MEKNSDEDCLAGVFLNNGEMPLGVSAPMSGALIGGQDCACELNSGERMLAGGGGMVRRPNSGEAAVVGGDRLLGGSPPAEGPLPGGNRQLR